MLSQKPSSPACARCGDVDCQSRYSVFVFHALCACDRRAATTRTVLHAGCEDTGENISALSGECNTHKKISVTNCLAPEENRTSKTENNPHYANSQAVTRIFGIEDADDIELVEALVRLYQMPQVALIRVAELELRSEIARRARA